MREAGLPPVAPGWRDAVAIAVSEALPVLKQGRKRLWGAMGVHQRERDGVGGQGPQPLQGMAARPGGRITGAHARLPGYGGDGFVGGHDRLRNAGDPCVHGPQADRHRQDGVAAVVDKAPRGPMHAGACADEGRHAWARAGRRLGGHVGFEVGATPRTDAWV